MINPLKLWHSYSHSLRVPKYLLLSKNYPITCWQIIPSTFWKYQKIIPACVGHIKKLSQVCVGIIRNLSHVCVEFINHLSPVCVRIIKKYPKYILELSNIYPEYVLVAMLTIENKSKWIATDYLLAAGVFKVHVHGSLALFKPWESHLQHVCQDDLLTKKFRGMEAGVLRGQTEW